VIIRTVDGPEFSRLIHVQKHHSAHDLGLLLPNVATQQFNIFLDILLLRIRHGWRSLLCALRLRGLVREGDETEN
jgi:hypothetical protein